MESEAKRKKYTKIPNEILEVISHTIIPGECNCVLHYILRKTYGWNKTEDWISLSQFAKGTKLTKPHVIRAINKLLERNIIVKTGEAKTNLTKKGNKQQPIYAIQMDFKKWVTSTKRKGSL